MATCEHVMGTVDPIARDFDPGQMVNLMKLACRRRLIDDRRHRKILLEVCLDKAGPLADPSVADPSESVEDRETVDIALEAIASLPALDRDVFRQRHLEGLTPLEIRLRNPGMTPRSYRRTIERANSTAEGYFDEIESGARCTEMKRRLLLLERQGAATAQVSHLVEVHLKRCRICRGTAARLRAGPSRIEGSMEASVTHSRPPRSSRSGSPGGRQGLQRALVRLVKTSGGGRGSATPEPG
jgi:hypothetical protein